MQMQSPASSFEVPAEMRAFAERSFEQARIAFDKFMEAAQQTMNTLEGQSKVAQEGAKEISQKIMGFAEQNVRSAFDYASRVVQVTDMQELMQLQAEYVKSQMATLQEQAKDFGSTFQSTVSSSFKKPEQG